MNGNQRLYWFMRLGMAALWIWTAYVSWFAFPHATSFDWLRQVGLSKHLALVLGGASALDLLMGVLSLALPSKRLWQAQCVLVAGYSLILALCLPQFLFHPFGPLTKNIAVLGCLAYLASVEKR
jgi:hypothetical protein